MPSTENKPSILLIDDTENLLEDLYTNLSGQLRGDDVDIRKWVPTSDNSSPLEVFESKVDNDTVLVVTDYDLTSRGVTGLFGFSIVGWCQARLIPVGDFSRGNLDALPKEPNLYELRVPSTEIEGAKFIASTFRGFRKIRGAIIADPDILSSKRSLAAVLAAILDRKQLESQFALYMSGLGSADSALVDRLRDYMSPERTPDDNEKTRLLVYVLGHVLLNAILKFPGPILGEKALCAYIATSTEEFQHVAPLFAKAEYHGPFDDGAKYFWRSEVDTTLNEMAAGLADEQFDTFGEFNRKAVETALGRSLKKHRCERCRGVNGGFLCPFTERPVCQRSDCSVTASSWIPQGAQLCRVEREFYDEWAPLLGL